jgi:hypothetical protein
MARQVAKSDGSGKLTSGFSTMTAHEEDIMMRKKEQQGKSGDYTFGSKGKQEPKEPTT